MSTKSSPPTSPSRPRPGGGAGPRPAGPAGTRPPGQTPSRNGAGHDHVATLAAGFVLLFLEVEAGRRPRRQLEPLLSPLLYARLGDVWVRGGPVGRLVTVHVAAATAGGCDVIALVRRGERCGALSLRLSRTASGRWLVADLARPEDGALPPPAYMAPVHPDEPDDDTDDVAAAMEVLMGG